MVCTDLLSSLSSFVVPCVKARSHLSPEDILKSDVMESISRVKSALDVLTYFKDIVNDKRNNLFQYQRKEMEVKPWDFLSSMVFAQLDRFIGRLKLLEVSGV